jgi:HAE1 family hydrophobic/amphiphilic exporter-1
MASSVATPLEQQFAAIPGLGQMTSTSGLGSTSISLQFELNCSIDGAAGDVQTAINAASGLLPKDLPNPLAVNDGVNDGVGRRDPRMYSDFGYPQ